MMLRVADTLEVRRWILAFGPEAELLEPGSLQEALRQDAEALARKLAPLRVPPTSIAPPVEEPVPSYRRKSTAPARSDR